MERLRVAINAQLVPDGPSGGIVTVLRALAALTELEDGVEEYVFIGPYEDPEWMRPMLPPGQPIVRGPEFMSSVGWRLDPLEPIKRRLGPLRPMARGVKRFLATQAQAMAAVVSPESDSGKQFAPATSREFFRELRLRCGPLPVPVVRGVWYSQCLQPSRSAAPSLPGIFHAYRNLTSRKPLLGGVPCGKHSGGRFAIRQARCS